MCNQKRCYNDSMFTMDLKKKKSTATMQVAPYILLIALSFLFNSCIIMYYFSSKLLYKSCIIEDTTKPFPLLTDTANKRHDVSLLATIELPVVEMTNHFFTASNFTQKVSFCYIPVLPMTLCSQLLPLLCFFL